MAHKFNVIGAYAELIARAALHANGWKSVGSCDASEAHDIQARHPTTDEWVTFQCKTINVRDDRRGELKVPGKKSNGNVYTKSDADMFIGVLVGVADGPRVWTFANREITEYWGPQSGVGKEWTELPLNLDRATLHGAVVVG